MKRAFLKQVKPISSSPYLPNPGSLNAEVGEPEQIQSVARRRLRTSAAMVGLALSMGATGLLVPRHGDGASAAESNETAASTPQATPRVAVLSSDLHELIATPPPSAGAASQLDLATLTDYMVGQGQTLQQIAQRYRISVEALAAVNQLSPTDVLKPGQLLRVPGNSSSASVMQSPQMQALSELSRLPVVDVTSQSQARAQSLSRLMQEQNKLKERLADLRQEDRGVNLAGHQTADVANKQAVSSPADSKQSSVADAPVVALTPTVIQTVTPSPELDWMRANGTLTVPSSTGSMTVAPTAVTPGSPLTTAQATKPEVTLPGQSAAPITTAMGLGTASEQSYQVSLGDTVALIARNHNIPPSALISANHLSDPNVIFVGQMLRVPATQSARANVPTVPTVLPASSATPIRTTSLPAVPTQVRQSQVQQSQVQQDSSTQLAAIPSILPSSIPVESLNLPAAPVVNTEAAERPDYVQNLLSEVKAMRERRSVQSRVQPTAQPEAETVAVESPVTADEPASRTTASLGRVRSNTPVVPAVRLQREPAVVAVAPLNPESYAPLTEQVPGRMVSPDLPALPGADHFLPDGTLTGYIWPAKGILTSGYGWRWGRMHAGIDIASDVGTPIYAAASGVVQYAGWNSGGYGNMVEIKHADGSMTRYGHMNAIYVREGQRIGQSEQIGEMGSTGYSTGPHLHFEVHPVADGGAVNPMAYLPAK